MLIGSAMMEEDGGCNDISMHTPYVKKATISQSYPCEPVARCSAWQIAWHLAQYVREGQRLDIYIIMIIYFGYVKFRDYEYLCWVKFGTHLSYKYDHEYQSPAHRRSIWAKPRLLGWRLCRCRLASRVTLNSNCNLKKKCQTNWEQCPNAFHRGQYQYAYFHIRYMATGYVYLYVKYGNLVGLSKVGFVCN